MMASALRLARGFARLCTAFIKGLLYATFANIRILPLLFERDVLAAIAKVVAANLFILFLDHVFLQKGVVGFIKYLGTLILGASPPTFVEYFCAGLFRVAFIAPVWLMVYGAASMPGFDAVSKVAYARFGKKAPFPSTPQDELYRHGFFALLAVQKLLFAAIVSLIPIGGVLFGVMAGAVNSLFLGFEAYDYAWSIENVPITLRHEVVERAWPYFVGQCTVCLVDALGT